MKPLRTFMECVGWVVVTFFILGALEFGDFKLTFQAHPLPKEPRRGLVHQL